MTLTTFIYNNTTYKFEYDASDASEIWCVDEIVNTNDYLLNLFNDIESGVFIDIGANCGVATIILGKQNPKSIIYTFEPDVKLFDILLKNIELNNLSNVRAFNKAVSKPGVKSLTLCRHPLYSGGNTTYSDSDVLKQRFQSEVLNYEVEVISLDDVVQQNNIDQITLLNIDCEGAEYDILYNAKCLSEQRIQNMVGEFHNLAYNTVSSTAEELIKYCRPLVPQVFKIQILTVA